MTSNAKSCCVLKAMKKASIFGWSELGLCVGREIGVRVYCRRASPQLREASMVRGASPRAASVPSGKARGYLLTSPAFRISSPIASTSCLAKERTSFGSVDSLSPAQIN